MVLHNRVLKALIWNIMYGFALLIVFTTAGAIMLCLIPFSGGLDILIMIIKFMWN